MRAILAVVLGAVVTLSLAPWNYWPLGILSAGSLWVLWHKAKSTEVLRLGWCYGVGFFGAGISWVYVSIHEHGNASAGLAGFLTVLFCALLAILFVIMGWVYRRFLHQRPLDISHALAFTGLWVLNEWIRTWFLTGFPWVFLGYGYIDTPLASWAPIGGVFTLSFIACLLGCLWALAITRRQLSYGLAAAGASIVAFGTGLLISEHEWTQSKQDTASVAIVQPNTPQDMKWNRRYYTSILDNLGHLSERAKPGDIIIWPEAAVPNYYHNALEDLKPTLARMNQESQSLISGIPFANRATQNYHNSIAVFAGGDGLYHKQRLVPFGEYVPLESIIRGLIDFFDLPMSNFSAGADRQAPLWVQNQIVAPSICYEVVYPDLVARRAHGSDWLLTISNDTWFGDSIGPLQHMQMAQMRALETQRYLVRGTSNGISAIVNPKGQIVSQTPQFVPAVLRGSIQSKQGSTPFMQTGSTPIIVLAIIAVLYGRHRQPALKT